MGHWFFQGGITVVTHESGTPDIIPSMHGVWDWIVANQAWTWIFSGVGVSAITGGYFLFKKGSAGNNGGPSGGLSISVSPIISPIISQSNLSSPPVIPPDKPSSTEPRIVFRTVPPAGAGGESRGTIRGWVVGVASPERFKIVLYAQTDIWYVQPLVSAPYTNVGADGFWSNWTHLGDRYAAFLVRRSFNPPPMTDMLPDLGGDVLCIGQAEASEE